MRHVWTTLLSAAALLATATPASADHVVVRPLTAACPANQVSATPFTDVAGDSPFELAISCLADYGTTRGRTATSYDPGGTVSRQQMAQFLFRLGTGADVRWDTSDSGFTDLGEVSAEAREAINALANAGVAQGRSSQVFDPNGAVTRAQMASFLARLAQVANAAGFDVRANAFDDDEGLTHEENIDRIAAVGVTAGRGSDRFFDPFSAVTRQQMAAFLARTLDVFVGQGLTASRFRADVAPATVTLDQDGQLVQPGSALTGGISGNRIRSAGLAAPCARGTLPVNGGFSVPTDPQATRGPCPVALAVTFDNGRTVTSEHRVVMPGYVDRPELVAVEPMETSQDSTTSQVRFLFDEPVQLLASDDPAAFFRLYGYLPSSTYSGSYRAQEVRTDGNAVIATFGTPAAPFGSQELQQIGQGVASGVVGSDGQPGVAGKVALEPGSSASGRHAGPSPDADLLTVTPSRTTDEPYAYDFTFDERLLHPADYEYNGYSDTGQYQFEVLLTDGVSLPCSAPEFVPARQITVVCAEADPDRVARGLVSYRHTEGNTGARGTQPRHVSLLRNQPTLTPDLVAVEPGPRPHQVTVVFDEPVTLQEQRFHVGDPASEIGIHAEQSPDDPTRIVLNGEGHNQTYSLEWVRLVTARGGAVTSRATGLANVLDQGWLQKPLLAPPAGAYQNLLRVVVDDQAVAHFVFSQYMALDDELGHRGWSHSTYLRDGTQLACTMGYEAADSPYPKPETNACRDFHVVGNDGTKLRPATADEVHALTLAVVSKDGNVDALLVEGKRR